MESAALIIGGVLVGLAVVVAVLSLLAPTRIAYTERIEVEAPAEDVYDDIRLQERLMRWSAWPRETGSTCGVDTSGAVGGADGEVGTRTVFYSRGKKAGHQEVVALEPGAAVAMTLVGAGPPHRPHLLFRLARLGPGRTEVLLEFTNEFPRPFNALWHFAGLSAWTRRMHLKDLQGLKAFSEPPHRDSDGRVVGRPPREPNPYEVRLPAAG